MSYGQGTPQPPNNNPGQYGNPAPQYGGTTYGGGAQGGQPTGGQPSGGQTYGGAPGGGQTYGAPAGGQTYGAPTSGQPYGAPTSGQPYGAPTSGQPYGAAPTSGQPYNGAPGGGQPYGGAPAGGPPPYGSGPSGGPPYGGPPQRQGTNGLSIAGLILAFVIAPVGFILSLIGLIQAGKRGQKGKGLAIAGILVSLLLMIGSGVLIAAIGNKVATLADPGCTTGKAAVLDNESKISNPDTIKDGLQTTVNGLNSAAAKAKNSDVKNAMKALADDYTQMLQAVNTGTVPDANLTTKIATDGAKVDSLCSITTK